MVMMKIGRWWVDLIPIFIIELILNCIIWYDPLTLIVILAMNMALSALLGELFYYHVIACIVDQCERWYWDVHV